MGGLLFRAYFRPGRASTESEKGNHRVAENKRADEPEREKRARS
jgi:hypothetical protein